MLSIDRLDTALLRMLVQDARRGVVDLSVTLGVSRNTVQSRLRRLEEAGILTGYRVEIDLAQVGAPVQAFLALEIQQAMLSDVIAHLTANPQVLEVHATTGREDLLVRVAAPSQAGLQDLIQQILATRGVVHSTTTLALTTPLPYRAMPFIEHITRETGWGRSTPAASDE
ncbi:Lrp/AsnC family transcriptional regulator [Rhodococcus sp. MSC1_016]|uniref:Lrp/AsnC family transcriptional regulator n=1 Tax=Rhodococcus sp. MSC1_016 TaxID=2909266 RepID=UPI00202DE810|nr:Lrp/AsnC family transcriptional regulator [Rhodococcus sp. MSC1_016]